MGAGREWVRGWRLERRKSIVLRVVWCCGVVEVVCGICRLGGSLGVRKL